jgi:hypothetical protein
MAGKRRGAIPNKSIVEALYKAGGNMSSAARLLGMTRAGLFKRIKKSAELAAAHDDAREVNLDAAEDSLMSAVRAGEGWAVCFYLKCQGKGRGYVERQEIKVEDVPMPTSVLISVQDGRKHE